MLASDNGWEDLSEYDHVELEIDASLFHRPARLGDESQGTLDIFISLVPTSVVTGLHKENNLKDASIIDTYALFAMRCYLYGAPIPDTPGSRVRVLMDQYVQAKKTLDKKLDLAVNRGGTLIPGKVRFEKHMSCCLFPPAFVMNVLTNQMASLLRFSQTVTLDCTAKKPFQGSPLYRYVPLGAKQRERWFVQLVAVLEGSGLPIVTGYYLTMPEQNLGGHENTLPWVQQVLREKEVCPIICTDEFYVSPNQIALCRQEKIPWLARIRNETIPEVRMMTASVKMEGNAYRIYRNESEGVSCTYIQEEEERRTKRYFLDNISKPVSDLEGRKMFPKQVDLYDNSAHGCKQLNQLLYEYRWPYQRRSWAKHFDSYVFTSLLITCYHLWLSAASSEDRASVSFHTFCMKLAEDILRWLNGN